MAKRKHKRYRIIPSDDVQGEGSYVKVCNLSIEEIVAFTGADKDASKLSPDEAANLGLKVLDHMIVEWDWVGDDDKPLPVPCDNLGTIATLPFQESTWLMEATGLSEMFGQKN